MGFINRQHNGDVVLSPQSQTLEQTGEVGALCMENRAQGTIPCPKVTTSSAPQLSLGVLDEEAADEVLGQLAGVAEIFLVKVVVDGGNVGQGLLLRLPQERGGSAQPAAKAGCDTPKRQQLEAGSCPAVPISPRPSLYSQDVSDDPDAPGRKRKRRVKAGRVPLAPHSVLSAQGDIDQHKPGPRDQPLVPLEGVWEGTHSPHVGLQPQGFIVDDFGSFRR